MTKAEFEIDNCKRDVELAIKLLLDLVNADIKTPGRDSINTAKIKRYRILINQMLIKHEKY